MFPPAIFPLKADSPLPTIEEMRHPPLKAPPDAPFFFPTFFAASTSQ